MTGAVPSRVYSENQGLCSSFFDALEKKLVGCFVVRYIDLVKHQHASKEARELHTCWNRTWLLGALAAAMSSRETLVASEGCLWLEIA